MDKGKDISIEQILMENIIRVREKDIPKVHYQDLEYLAFYDIEKLIDILVFLLKESYCNPDIAVDVKVKILENENKILKERISSLERAESYASRRYRIERGEKKIAEKEMNLETVLDLWNQGYSISKIARVLSLSRPTVYNRLDKLVEFGALKKDYREQRREERSNCVHPKKESDKDDFVSINLRL